VLEKAFPSFFGNFFYAQAEPLAKRGVSVHKNSLAPLQMVLSQCQATRSDVSVSTKKSECFVTGELLVTPGVYLLMDVQQHHTNIK